MYDLFDFVRAVLRVEEFQGHAQVRNRNGLSACLRSSDSSLFVKNPMSNQLACFRPEGREAERERERRELLRARDQNLGRGNV